MAAILNQRQYRITKSWVRRFEKTLAEFLTSEQANALPPKQRQLEEDAIRGQLETLQAEVAEYEALLASAQPLEVRSFAELPRALIRARIASDMTQKELAERLGLKEQQIQRYESSEYKSASMERIAEIMAALNVEIDGMRLRFAQAAP
ncbi:helix-turn-helix domain-containing protein [Armatimonas sp.]|uniref:helix-turn-helix transcriptional regulator n=1 Tax=Armatimonas sp. TaxID=1872638 RepID=UPI0037510159